MTTEQLKNYIKAADPDFAAGNIRLGGVDGNSERFLAVLPEAGKATLCLGGAECTTTEELRAKLLLRWGKAQPAAEAKAKAVWGLFHGLTDTDMDGAHCYYAEPGPAPVPIGYGSDGVYEYVINLKLTNEKE